jgi:hypothetical protein
MASLAVHPSSSPREVDQVVDVPHSLVVSPTVSNALASGNNDKPSAVANADKTQDIHPISPHIVSVGSAIHRLLGVFCLQLLVRLLIGASIFSMADQVVENTIAATSIYLVFVLLAPFLSLAFESDMIFRGCVFIVGSPVWILSVSFSNAGFDYLTQRSRLCATYAYLGIAEQAVMVVIIGLYICRRYMSKSLAGAEPAPSP